MSNQKENSKNSFSEKNATTLLLFKGDVSVNNLFVHELEQSLKDKQNSTKFNFTLGIDKKNEAKSLIQELEIKYNCKINLNSTGHDLLGLTGEYLINKKDVPNNIIELQNFCKEKSIVPIDFSIMI